jgi:hypothetical protein
MKSLAAWRSSTAIVVALLLTTSQGIAVMAQPRVFSQRQFPSGSFPESRPGSRFESRSVVIPAGTTIPVAYEEAEKILLKQEETMEITLTVPANLRNRAGLLLVPYGSEITGRLEPYRDGTRFVAEEIMLPNGVTRSLNAASDVVTRTEVIEEGADVGKIASRAAIGAAAAAAISIVTGDNSIGVTEVLIGAGLGALSGWLLEGRDEVELISVRPETDLDLTLQSPLMLDN